MDYLVRDISLYPSGDDKIEWVRRNMRFFVQSNPSLLRSAPLRE
jgi:S-adenosylhomocysteine hydrolase